MNANQKIKLTLRTGRLFDVVMNELETIYHTRKEKYHILGFLINMLEEEEEKLWKEINK